ncbi:MAG TPA: ubiquitin-like domain-containing protein [Actinomycetota bacterium]|nr:ubiquitin-like domain-containing protein [Actinomycetota bacterium]
MQRRLVRALVLVTALAAPGLAFGGEKLVHLDVEGSIRPVVTYASSGPELVERKGLGSPMRVDAPGSISAGDTVRVRRAKPVTLLVDGEPRRVVVHGLTVGEALSELGLSVDDHDHLTPPPDTPVIDGLPVVVRNAVATTVVVDGRSREILSSADTVGRMLSEAGIEVGPHDIVRPPPSTSPGDGMSVRVVRVRTAVQTRTLPIPAPVEERPDPSLPAGQRRIASEGGPGTRTVRQRLVFHDGEIVARTTLDSRVERRPEPKVVRVGTARAPRNVQEGVASWFRAPGLTAAHRTLAFGTVVKVTNLSNGRSVHVTIRDRGPFVEGRIIDLSHGSFEQLAPLNTGTFRVRIEW